MREGSNGSYVVALFVAIHVYCRSEFSLGRLAGTMLADSFYFSVSIRSPRPAIVGLFYMFRLLFVVVFRWSRSRSELPSWQYVSAAKQPYAGSGADVMPQPRFVLGCVKHRRD